MVQKKAGAILQATAFSRAHLVIGRVICGVGTGIDTSTAPMYQAELSHAKNRGRLVCSECFFVFIGIVIAYWYDYGMSFVNNPISWRLPIGSQVIFAIVSYHHYYAPCVLLLLQALCSNAPARRAQLKADVC
jgi:MFS family permease